MSGGGFVTERDRTFPVAEVFGPTIQGEGAMQGSVTHFIRFGGCDYRCKWCDSPHAVLPRLVRELPKLTADEIMDALSDLGGNPDWITFSGGNPGMLKLDPLVDLINLASWKVNVETQGTRFQPWMAKVAQVTVSPKPPSAAFAIAGLATPVGGTPEDRVRAFLEQLRTQADLIGANPAVCLKVVVFDDDDYGYARRMHLAFPDVEFWLQVGNPDPGPTVGNDATGSTDDPAPLSELLDRLKWLCEKTAADPAMGSARVCPQMHVLCWQNERGR